MTETADKPPEDRVDDEGPYVMHIDMRVLDHLGIHLYSNAAAVLSEAVANAWDADTQRVSVTLADDKIVVEDDGVGMDLAVINDRFLKVGYDKRSNEGGTSAKGRRFMGRKGIGKLSLFSIADVVTVHTVRNGETHAFKMSTTAIEAAIKAHKPYRPEKVDFDGPAKGTRIVMTSLKKRASHGEQPLRKRIARRFSIIGFEGKDGDKFDVVVNDKPITHQDRDDLKGIEFIWTFGQPQFNLVEQCPAMRHHEVINNEITGGKGWKVGGWLGAAPRPTDLRKDEAGSMNGIVVVAHGRLIQENILEKLDFNKLFASYVTGQVEADFLDIDTEPDIATSDRQRLIEDDERYVALVAFLRRVLYDLAEKWPGLRNETRGKDAVEKNPGLDEWINHLPEGQQAPARKMIGLIEGVEVEKEDDRRALYRAGVLAFERLRLKEASHELGNLKELTAEKLLPLLVDLAALEGSMYRDVVQGRLAVLERFTGLVDDDAKEKVLQKTIFQNMWLLDAGWERAAESERMEEILKREYKEFADDLSEEQSKGRIDIRYRTNAGQHIIVELKRANRALSLGELIDQGEKYRTALTACVKAVEGSTVVPNVAVVFVLGKPVVASDSSTVDRMMATASARVVYYDTLIQNSRNAYAEFLERSKRVDAIDDFISKF